MRNDEKEILLRLVNDVVGLVHAFESFKGAVCNRLDELEHTVASLRTGEIRDILDEARRMSNGNQSGHNGDGDKGPG